MTSNNSLAIGIDLGTTYSCVGVYRNGRVEIIPNADGNRTTPSVIGFTETTRLIGDAAKNQAAMNVRNTIYDVKRLIGQPFSSPAVQAELANLTFQVESSQDDQPRIKVCGDRLFSPEELSAMVLSSLKESAEKYLGQPVSSAVITCPAFFSEVQRQATKVAGEIAGLNVLRIINEPTSAALAYGLERLGDLNKLGISSAPRHILVVDVGGGTLDSTLLCVEEGVYEVLATSGDLHLGGEDFDLRLADYLAQEFKRKHKVDLTGNYRALKRLRNACEKAKRVLSSATQASIEIDALAESIDFSTIVSRARFEELCIDLFKSILIPIQTVLADAKKSKQEIDDVILVGGSTRVPKIQQIVSEFFDGKPLCTSINADESIAYGASVQAALLNKDQKDSRIESMVLVDVVALSVGVEVAGNKTAIIIPRNTTIPTEKKQIFTTYADNQTSVLVRVLEGERSFSKDCRLLGEFHLEGIPPAPKSVPTIEVKFEIDANGILNVSAVEKSSGKANSVRITNRGSLSDSEIERMVKDAQLYAEADKREVLRIDARSSLENYIWQIKKTMSEQTTKEKLDTKDIGLLGKIVNENLSWLDENSDAALDTFLERKNELEKYCNAILKKLLSAPSSQQQPSSSSSRQEETQTPPSKFKPPTVEEL